MHITELDSYNLADAVKFNDELNPAIWAGQQMKPEVRAKLLAIADDFREFLGLTDLEVKDITVSGSNAAYTYTPHSDIDLHLVVDIPQADADEVYRELFDAKKYQYNDLHDYKIHGYDVELYVENANKPPVSQGIYSIKNDDWIKIPLKRKATVNDEAVKSKFEDIGHRIESAVKSQDYQTIDKLAKKIKNFRQAGLDKSGEFGPENLAYKMLRTQGLIKKLYDARNAALDAELSLTERKKKKKKKKVKYGFGGYWYPGYSFNTDGGAGEVSGDFGGGGEMEDLDTDGVMMTRPTNCSSEAAVPDAKPSDEAILKDFIDFCSKELKLKALPQVKLRKDPQWSVVHKTFGRYIDDRNMLEVAWGQRHIMDVLRTVAHELTHRRQHEREDVPPSAGETGSPYENEANARAGILMRDYARLHPEYFEAGQAEQLHSVEEGVKEKLGAMAAAACIAGTPGCATTDIQSGVRAAQTIGNLSQIKRGNIERALGQDAKNVLRRAAGQVQNEASGYIPTKKQAKLPQFSNALSVDVRPGQVGKEANKMGLKTDSQGHPQLLIKGLKNALREFKETGRLDVKTLTPAEIARKHGVSGRQILAQLAKGIEVELEHTTDKKTAREIALDHLNELPDYYDRLSSVEQLDEVRMAPSNLKQFADSEDAAGIMAGFEAELIFRDTQGEEDADDYEADYDADERAYSIEEVIDFFSNDDYGYGLSDRQADRLREQLDEAYFEWRDDQIISDFEREADDLVREQWLEERPMSERILSALTDGIGLDDAEADRILAAGEKAPRFTKNSDQEAYKQENSDYATYLEAADIADEVLDEEVEASLSNQDGIYDQALDNFRDNWDGDDSSFFTDMGWRWMSSIANEFNLDWPIMSGGRGNDGSRSWEDIADSLRRATGQEVHVGGGYHRLRRGNYYVLEPDGSLDPDDPSEQVGLEIVSPPMPLNQAIEQLNKVIEWADGEGDAYTNRSTGLHMGISVPYKGGDVDYVKLALFMGDQYVLERFGRTANTYCDSALKKLKQNVAGSKNRGDTKIASAMELMKNGLIELAQRYVQQGVGQAKYTSVHIKPGYIEFRSPGGDYLSTSNREIGALEDTMRRFAYAMYLAGRPDLERPEYYKKLYKLIAPEGSKDLELFAKFSAGELTAEELKKQWAERVISKEVPGGVGPKSNWKLYNRFTKQPVVGLEFNNYTEMDALERAKARVSPASSMMDFKQTYELRDVGTNTGRWSVIRSDNGETLEVIDAATRGAAADEAYEKYTNVIPFYIEPYSGGDQEPEPKLSRRAQLAKQIAQPKDYVLINKHSGLTFYTFSASSLTQAVDFGLDYLRNKGLDVENFSVQRASNVKQSVDNAVDSRQLQQRVAGDRYEIVDRRTGEIELQYSANSEDDAHNKYNNWLRNQGMPVDTENYGYRPVQTDPGQAQRAQNIRDAAPRADFEVYVHDRPEEVFHSMDNATAEEVRAYIERQEQGGMPPGLLRVRQVTNETYNRTQQQQTQLALDTLAQKAGFKNFAAVPQGKIRIDIMRKAVDLLKKNTLEETLSENTAKKPAVNKSTARQWTAKIHVKNPQYAGWVDVNTWAPNIAVARQMFKQQYNIQDWHITAIKEVK